MSGKASVVPQNSGTSRQNPVVLGATPVSSGSTKWQPPAGCRLEVTDFDLPSSVVNPGFLRITSVDASRASVFPTDLNNEQLHTLLLAVASHPMVRSECYEFLKTVQKPTLVAEDADKVLNEHLRLHMLGDSTVFDTDLPERMKNTALPLKAYLETCKNKYQIKFYASTYVFTIGGLCDFIRGKRLRLCPKTCYYDKRRELLKPSVDAEFKALH